MRLVLVSMALAATMFVEACQVAKPSTRSATPPRFAPMSLSTASKPDFDSEIKPIFQARCQRCHFEGGKVYKEMPFDKPETIHRLGTKLFTRIKDEEEQQKIREFLGQP